MKISKLYFKLILKLLTLTAFQVSGPASVLGNAVKPDPECSGRDAYRLLLV